MPPTFRSSRSGRQFGDGVNRTRTGQVDHDVFEGLPVRRWTRQVQTISQEPKTEGTESKVSGNAGKPSIPEHPMPRDSHLLNPMSRALLRAARSGCIYIRKASRDFDDEEKEITDPEEQQTQQSLERNFSMRKWTTVPKHLEAPEVEFLAKRRPGLPSLYGATAGTVDGAGSVPMRKTRFKKVDPVTGNILIYAAWVPEGHKIEGEITDEVQVAAESTQATVTPQAPAPGTVIEGVGVVNAQGVVVAAAGSAAVITPPKRRPPPPKRKGKGLKGRRKKVMFAPGEGADAALVHGAVAGDAVSYAKDTDPSRLSVDQTTQDDEDDEGDEGEESEDGEGDESGFDPKTPETPGLQPSTEPEPTPGLGTEPTPTPGPATTEITADIKTPQVSQAPEPKPEPAAEPLPASPQSVAPLAPSSDNPAASASLSSPAQPVQAPETAITASVMEDIQMTDATTTENTLHPAPTLQSQAALDVAQPPSLGKAPSPPQEPQQSRAPKTTNVTAENAQPPTVEQPDVTMEEAGEPVPEPPQAEPESMDLSTEAPQTAFPEQAPGHDFAPQQADQPPSQNEFDLLDNLEASLDLPRATPSDAQKEASPEQRPEAASNQVALTESEPAAPAQPTEAPAEPRTTESTTETVEPPREEPVAPPVEQLTPPEAEQLTPAGISEQPPQEVSPVIEQQQPEKVPEAPTAAERLVSNEPAPAPEPEAPQPTTEAQEEKPQESVAPEPAVPAGPEPAAQPHAPAAEEHLVQHPAVPAVDPEQEQQAQASPNPTPEATAEPREEPAPEQLQSQPAAQEPHKEVSRPQAEPLSPLNPEPAVAEPTVGQEEAQAGAVREQGTSGDGPSSNGEQQVQ
ncbi:uncharacterized protein DSM5745_02820 [Aspergillus mulundensis]|uniref:LYR family protein n=1 Tax=Aspergillus mulundensis TaxID=1810919 RepID=A0A3D8SK78_9EURO|nr:hypothetical protein DSM5745_02820 [Aspergillus mulundensis]RDW86178.1 hypothetical protein DSM5745_02820 [Aspergillus mulundensis]